MRVSVDATLVGIGGLTRPQIKKVCCGGARPDLLEVSSPATPEFELTRRTPTVLGGVIRAFTPCDRQFKSVDKGHQ